MTATYIVLMGVQGAGKGTQALELKTHYNLPHITTGGIFREMKNEDTPLAREIQEIMAAGRLISDEITVQVVRERLKKPDTANGIILDGFPRTLQQAQALDALLADMGQKVTVVPFLKLSREAAIERISGRWQCSHDSSHVYNLKSNPPKVAGVCDFDGAPLMQRKDDTVEAVTLRINDFFALTAPVIDYYRASGNLREVEADQPIEKVTADMIAVIDSAIKGRKV